MTVGERVITLFEEPNGSRLDLPPELTDLYGPLYMPTHHDRPHVISSYVSTMDGVVSLGLQSAVTKTKGTLGEVLSGFSVADKVVMALMHAVADVLIVGETGVRGNPRDAYRAEAVYPPLTDAFRLTRTMLGKPAELPVAVLAPQGELDPAMPMLNIPGVRIVLLTSEVKAPSLAARGFPPAVTIRTIPMGEGDLFAAREVISEVANFQPADLILCDTGPRFLANLINEKGLDEIFLTVAPHLAGRDGTSVRPGLVDGVTFLPADSRQADLVSVKRAENTLMLRYALRYST